MILVIGAIGAGKYDYVKSIGYSDEMMSDGKISELPVVLNAQNIVARGGDNGLGHVDALAEKEVVCCCEVGSGVIPLARDEREWREAVGRMCNALAKRAEKVVRIVAGIPVTIKG